MEIGSEAGAEWEVNRSRRMKVLAKFSNEGYNFRSQTFGGFGWLCLRNPPHCLT